MKTQEELNNLSQLIENEIHATHSISDKTYSKINDVLNSIPNIHKPIRVVKMDPQLITKLSPLAFKLFQYLLATLDDVIPEAKNSTIQHVSNIVLYKSLYYLPSNPEIYISYAIRRMIDDRDEFIKECHKDQIIEIENKSTLFGNMISYFSVILVFIVFISISVCTFNKNEKLKTKTKQLMNESFALRNYKLR